MHTNDLLRHIGFDPDTRTSVAPDKSILELVNLRLAMMGQPIAGDERDFTLLSMGKSLVSQYRSRARLIADVRAPVDQRIETFLAIFLGDLLEGGEAPPRLPGQTFGLTQHGMARLLSLPAAGDEFKSSLISSYRLANGVLHNPASDRRTTKGVFHLCEDGLPVPADKKSVPRITYLHLLRAALQPPEDLMELPITANQDEKARAWVSLLLRPVVCPAIPGFIEEKRMEVRFFAPGNLVSNLDFVESIFGNAGDPYLPENDAGVDVRHWSGHTGCIILAPHLIRLKKKDVGLPHISEATDRQKRDGMCWEKEDELYNDGGAFKITARDERGVVVTLIADNYFGYCKKEVKTQIGFAVNLMGVAEEEHAGGAMAFASYDLGEDFRLGDVMSEEGYTFAGLIEREGDHIDVQPEGYGIDKAFPEIIYIPEKARFSLNEARITWSNASGEQKIKLLAEKVYILPTGYKVRLIKPAEGRRWRLIGTVPEATLCHKPCTVSGGGKSEISKSIADAIIHAPFYVSDIRADFDEVDRLLKREYGDRFKDTSRHRHPGRPILSSERTLGSVIKLLTPSDEFTDEYNAFLDSIPPHIKELILLVKRFYKADWGDDWKSRFSVNVINGQPGHELKYRDREAIASYLRVGYEADGSWRVFSLRKDFAPAMKIQTEDDITASVTVPAAALPGARAEETDKSVKVIYNCEFRLFQRPDDAIVRGYDKKTEYDISRRSAFLSNYEPLDQAAVREIVEDAVRFDYFTEPMKELLRDFVENPEKHPKFLVCSAYPRIFEGKPSKNPRYLQTRLNLESPRASYIADLGMRLRNKLPESTPVVYPVNAVLPGRRNNPPDGPIRNLAVFNPIHYMPLPEAFMEFISSMTGKSPSTTGAGSEGALTKGPFNMLLPITDLNNALLSTILGGYEPFITAAGYVGPKFRVDHDISLLVPEVWSRMRSFERSASWLIENGYLEAVPDFEHKGETVPSSLLGYRINQAFVTHFMGRIFGNPSILFDEAMLQPELQGMDDFVDGMKNMVETHRRVALLYFEDGSIDLACPPLRAILHYMAHGEWEGHSIRDSGLRDLFDREKVLASAWYRERLERQAAYDRSFWEARAAYLDTLEDGPLIQAARDHVFEQIRKSTEGDPAKVFLGMIGRDRLA